MSDEPLLASEVLWPCQHKMGLYVSLPPCPYCKMHELQIESERLVDSYLTLLAESRVLQERVAELELDRELIAEYLLSDPPFDVHEEASINASAFGRGVPSANDYYASFIMLIRRSKGNE